MRRRRRLWVPARLWGSPAVRARRWVADGGGSGSSSSEGVAGMDWNAAAALAGQGAAPPPPGLAAASGRRCGGVQDTAPSGSGAAATRGSNSLNGVSSFPSGCLPSAAPVPAEWLRAAVGLGLAWLAPPMLLVRT